MKGICASLSSMKRIILSLILGCAAFSTPASAWVGGPFDNGFHSDALERNSIYQAAFSLANGSGYCYFSPEAMVAPETAVSTTVFDARGSVRNRAVLYYKGVTYVGSAMGMVDGEARRVECEMNGSSELSVQAQNNNNNNNNSFVLGASSSAPSVLGQVVSNNRSFTFNGSFEAKIYQTAPSLRFRGKGTLAFLSPTSADSLAGLAFTSYSGLIQAIISFVGGSTLQSGAQTGLISLFSTAQTAITNALDDLKLNWLNKGGIDDSFKNAEKASFTVRGSRRYL